MVLQTIDHESDRDFEEGDDKTPLKDGFCIKETMLLGIMYRLERLKAEDIATFSCLVKAVRDAAFVPKLEISQKLQGRRLLELYVNENGVSRSIYSFTIPKEVRHIVSSSITGDTSRPGTLKIGNPRMDLGE